MKNINSIAVIGGDSRQLFASQHLAQSGFDVSVFAAEHGKISEETDLSDSLTQALESEILLLPLPVSKNGKTINTPLSSQEITIKALLDAITDRHTVFYGMGTDIFKRILTAKTKKQYDYFTSENLIYKNAYLTAEGLVGIILEKMPVSLRGLKIAVTGYGRIGTFCSSLLKKMGADVTVFTGTPLKIAKAELTGIKGERTENLLREVNKFDCIINTAPSRILDENIIKNTNTDCLIIESASAPYGIDFDACTKHNRQLIKAFSLPGKTAPKSAGIIIAETVMEKLQEVTK